MVTIPQLKVLDVLSSGGYLIKYDKDRGPYLLDKGLNELKIHWPTFKKLIELGYIDSRRSMSLNADEYAITKKGQIARKTYNYLYEEK